jgi:hypothetical protein
MNKSGALWFCAGEIASALAFLVLYAPSGTCEALLGWVSECPPSISVAVFLLSVLFFGIAWLLRKFV